MPEPGYLAVKAGIAVGRPVIGVAMRQLEDGEREQIRKSFALALKWSRASEEERAIAARGGARRIRRGSASALARGGKSTLNRLPIVRGRRKAKIDDEREIREAIELGAADLTRAWTEGPPKAVAGGGQVVDWIAVLHSCVKETAREGATAACRKRAEHWRYLITGNRKQPPTDSSIQEWAGKAVEQVVMLWNRKPRLRNMVAQLNVESGLGLQKGLVVASQSISHSLKWIAFSTTTAIVVGGGGVALLVLFLDKG